MTTLQQKDDQNTRYAVTIVVYIILLICAIALFWLVGEEVPTYIPVYDFVILALCTFRLVRLFVYDQIMRVVRDMFMDIREVPDPVTGEIMIERVKPAGGPKRSLSDLVGCPWCMGIWISYVVVLLYFAFPPVRYVALILALAGVASSLQIIMNGVGAKAEFFKHENNLRN